MHQQINLYQPVFRKQQKVFSALTLLQISAAVLVLLILVTGHARWTLNDMRGTSRTLDAQLNTLKQQLGILEDSSKLLLYQVRYAPDRQWQIVSLLYTVERG